MPNFLTLYPNFEAFAQAMIAGTLPVDLSGLQAAGVQTSGTPYSKATCLPDSVEQAIWGSAANRNIGQALQQLRSLITTAEGTIPKILAGSYVGNNTNSKSISFSAQPKLVIVAPTEKITGATDSNVYNGRVSPALIFLYGCVNSVTYEIGNMYNYLTLSDIPLTVTWSGTSMSWTGGQTYTAAYNRAGLTYNWLAIC